MSTGRSRRLFTWLPLWLLLILLAGATCHKMARPGLPAGSPPSHKTVASNDTASLMKLDPGKVDERGPFGWTPLHVAAIFDRSSAAEILLKKRAHLNAVDQAGMTPLHWAARMGSEGVVEILLRSGAEIMSRNKLDMTPLHEASTAAVARALLERGADLHARDIDGMTPLHTAPNKPVADLFIKRGANINALARDGRSPMDMPPGPRPRLQ